eukprot:g83356.t1
MQHFSVAQRLDTIICFPTWKRRRSYAMTSYDMKSLWQPLQSQPENKITSSKLFTIKGHTLPKKCRKIRILTERCGLTSNNLWEI